MVVESVEFDTGLGGAELGPREQRQAEINDRSIKAEQLVVKREFVLRGFGLAPLVQFQKEGLEERVGAAVVGIREGGPGHVLGPEVIEPLGEGVHAQDPITKAFPVGELEVEQVDKLIPSGKDTRFPAALMLLG